jgi:hypothetical protein
MKMDSRFRGNDGKRPDLIRGYSASVTSGNESGSLQQPVTPDLIRVPSVPVTPGEDPGSILIG